MIQTLPSPFTRHTHESQQTSSRLHTDYTTHTRWRSTTRARAQRRGPRPYYPYVATLVTSSTHQPRYKEKPGPAALAGRGDTYGQASMYWDLGERGSDSAYFIRVGCVLLFFPCFPRRGRLRKDTYPYG
jgi:hypothetical protein